MPNAVFIEMSGRIHPRDSRGDPVCAPPACPTDDHTTIVRERRNPQAYIRIALWEPRRRVAAIRGGCRRKMRVAAALWRRRRHRFAGRLGGGVARALQAAASWWRWSLSRLWVAVRRRHSDLTADLPRRSKRLAPRWDFTWPNTGSTMPWRCR